MKLQYSAGIALLVTVALTGCTAANNNANTAAPTRAATVAQRSTPAPVATSSVASVAPASATRAAATVTQTVVSAAPSQAATVARTQTADSAPCLAGQVKANQTSKIYFVSTDSDYARLKNNVACFNSPAEAQAAGYRAAQR